MVFSFSPFVQFLTCFKAQILLLFACLSWWSCSPAWLDVFEMSISSFSGRRKCVKKVWVTWSITHAFDYMHIFLFMINFFVNSGMHYILVHFLSFYVYLTEIINISITYFHTEAVWCKSGFVWLFFPVSREFWAHSSYLLL